MEKEKQNKQSILKVKVNDANISIWIENVTPAFASEILAKYNTKNRKENANHTRALLRNIIEGTWRFNGDTICFDSNSTLIDGQHRLSAITKSGKTVPCLFVHGLDPEAIKTKDVESKPRNLSDLFKMDDLMNYSHIASIIQKYFVLHVGRVAMISGKYGKGSTISGLNTTATMESKYNFYYQNQVLMDEVVAYARDCYVKNRLFQTSELGGLFVYLYLDKHHSEDEIKTFFDGIILGSNFGVLNILRNKLIVDKGAIKKMTSPHKQALIAKAWNYYIKGKEVKILSYNAATEGSIDFI